MIEYVFRPSRLVAGKRVVSRVFSGRYAAAKGERPVTVRLNTPDREIARKRLRAIVLEKQREQEGIIAPKAVRTAAAMPLGDLVSEYERDMRSRGLDRKHVHNTITRLRRMVAENRWRFIGDVRPAPFLQWRGRLTGSAKTRKEYQVSACSFLNWLVKTERVLANPLAKIEHIEVRGKAVRLARALAEEELQRLFANCPKRRLAYQMLLYTGQRKSEVRALVWGDLHLDDAQPYVLFREGTTKDKDKRAVPLRRELAGELRRLKPEGVDPAKRVFARSWPIYDTLRADFKRAGIEWKDALGRVVHFHSFRKTWQTWGVRYGINQRAAQELLGHSDANLTAKVYTDVPALSLHEEVAKLPWIGDAQSAQKFGDAQIDAQKSEPNWHLASLADILAKLVEAVKLAPGKEVGHALSFSDTDVPNAKLGAGVGFEGQTRAEAK